MKAQVVDAVTRIDWSIKVMDIEESGDEKVKAAE